MLELALLLFGIFLGLGLLFGLAFVFKGAAVIDPAAVNGTLGFKLLILPGCVVLWPYLLTRWLRQAPPPEERSAHRRAKPSSH